MGIDLANESAGEAPWSFVVRSDGTLVLLDQLNKRLQLFNGGGVERVVPLDDRFYTTMALLSDDVLVISDSFRREEIVVMSVDGTVHERIPYRKLGFDEPEQYRELLTTADGVWATDSTQGGYRRLLNRQGSPAELAVTERVPARNGSERLYLIRTSFEDLGSARVTLSRFAGDDEQATHTFQQHLERNKTVELLGSDCGGAVAVLVIDSEAPVHAGRATLQLFDRELELARQEPIPFLPGERISADFGDQFVFTSQGVLYLYELTATGISIRKFAPPLAEIDSSN